MTAVTVVTEVRKNHATSPQSRNLSFFFYCLSTFRKSNLKQLTTDMMFSGQRFAILAMFCVKMLRDFSLKRLRDFLCEEFF